MKSTKGAASPASMARPVEPRLVGDHTQPVKSRATFRDQAQGQQHGLGLVGLGAQSAGGQGQHRQIGCGEQ